VFLLFSYDPALYLKHSQQTTQSDFVGSCFPLAGSLDFGENAVSERSLSGHLARHINTSKVILHMHTIDT
jgi:hypothetical protein